MFIGDLDNNRSYGIEEKAKIDMLKLVRYDTIIELLEDWMKEIGINEKIVEFIDNFEEIHKNDEENSNGGKDLNRVSFKRIVNLPFTNKRPGYDYKIINRLTLNINVNYPSRRANLFLEFSLGQHCYFISFPDKQLQSIFFAERFLNFIRDSYDTFKKEQFSQIVNHNLPDNVVYDIPENIKSDMLNIINHDLVISIIEKWMQSIDINKKVEVFIDTREETKKNENNEDGKLFSISFKRNIELPFETNKRKLQYREKSYISLYMSAIYPAREADLYVEFLLGNTKCNATSYHFSYQQLQDVEVFEEILKNIIRDGYKTLNEENTSYIIK